jgi:hypothetical protein
MSRIDLIVPFILKLPAHAVNECPRVMLQWSSSTGRAWWGDFHTSDEELTPHVDDVFDFKGLSVRCIGSSRGIFQI